MSVVLLSFILFLLASTIIGLASAYYKKGSRDDYLLASRDVGPVSVALSAVASNNSGFMFIGLIGSAYTYGVSTMWLMFGWWLGDLTSWFFVHKRLRIISEKKSNRTFPSFISGSSGKSLPRILSALLLIAFLGTYAAAQMTAGSKALHVLLGWDYSSGAILAALIIVLYCFAGGIRASIWTDVFQSCVMFFSMCSLCLIALNEVGGFQKTMNLLQKQNPALIEVIPEGLKFGFPLYLMSWLAAGFGVIGQPHIMSRAMVLRDPEEMNTARNIYAIWYALFSFASISVGLLCRVLLPEVGSFDAELALPRLAETLLPQIFVGVMLAGLFSATMSTTDSQIIACSSALTEDLAPEIHSSVIWNKLSTLLMTGIALAIALSKNANVFSLVVLAWSGLAVSFGPLVFIRSLGMALPSTCSLLMMINGSATVLLWRFYLDYSSHVYEVLPGFMMSLATYVIYRILTGNTEEAQ